MFKSVNPKEIGESAIKLIGDDWMLIGAESGGKINAMTASWGGMGFLWGKEVAFVFIRPSRYTFELLEKSDLLSLNFLPERFRPQLAYCGKVSGRDENKVAACQFSMDFHRMYIVEIEKTLQQPSAR